MNAGLNFSNMNKSNNKIEEKLQDPNTKIEDLLMEEEIIQEFTYQGHKFTKFFTKERVKDLVDYIIKEPKEDDPIKGHKLPFIACELLNAGERAICNYFCFNKEELKKELQEEENELTKNKSIDMKDTEIEKEANKEENKETMEKKEEKKDENEKKEENKEEKKEEQKEEQKEEKKEEAEKKEEKKEEAASKEENKEQTNQAENNEQTAPTAPQTEKKKENKEDDQIPNDHIELLDYVLTFLETKEELNYVLVGYFEKFLHSLICRRPLVLISYLFKIKKDSLDNMIYHSYRKSISELLLYIIGYEKHFCYAHHDYKDEDESTFDSDKQISKIREEILEQLFKQISEIDKVTNSEQIPNIICLIKDLIEEPNILKTVINNENILSFLFNNLKVDLTGKDVDLSIKLNYIEILGLIMELIKKVLSQNNLNDLPHYDNNNNDDGIVEQQGMDSKIEHTCLSKHIFDTLDDVLKNFIKNESFSEVETTFDEKIPTLGSFRVKIVEYICSLLPYLKKIAATFDRKLTVGERSFFKAAFEYVFKFPWNNFYQQEFLILIKKYFEEQYLHTIITKHIFEDIGMIKLLKEGIVDKNNPAELNQYEFKTSKNKIINGNVPFLVSLGYKINVEIGGEPLNLFSKSREGSITFVNRIDTNDSGSGFNGIFSNEEKDNKKDEESLEEKKDRNSNLYKYKDEQWGSFFDTFIKSNVKNYENKLCEKKELSEFDELVKESNTPIDNKNESDDSNPFASGNDSNPFADDYNPFAPTSNDKNLAQMENKYLNDGKADDNNAGNDFGFEFPNKEGKYETDAKKEEESKKEEEKEEEKKEEIKKEEVKQEEKKEEPMKEEAKKEEVKEEPKKEEKKE